jgi:hypothetical protein
MHFSMNSIIFYPDNIYARYYCTTCDLMDFSVGY